MQGVTIYQKQGMRFAVWQARILDEMPSYEGRGNPMLWWCEDITDPDNKDWLCGGVKTLRECERAIDEMVGIVQQKEPQK